MNNKQRIVITGAGVVAPNGIGREKFCKAIQDGVYSIKPITIFDTELFQTHTAGECTDFKAEDYLGSKGLRNLDRSTKLVSSAAKLCLDDAGLAVTEQNTDDIGVVTATTLSVIFNISEFTKEAADSGPHFVNPAMFPGTTINSPSSHVSIRFGIKGFNTTVSTGFTASLDALKYARDFIALGRAKAVLVAGVEALFFQSYVGFHKLGFLAGINGQEISCPFDKRHNGIVLSEGAGVILLEDESHARSRKARIYGELKGTESFFEPFRSGRYGPKADGLKRSIIESMRQARLKPKDIDYINSSANSVALQDQLETQVIKNIFGSSTKIPVSSIKSMIGETVSATGILQIIAGLGALEAQSVPPTINYQELDPSCSLDYVPNKSRKTKLRNILINNFGPGGNSAACVIGSLS